MAKPDKQFRMGSISISIFNNGGFYSAAPQRAYKKDGVWSYSSQFRPADMAVLLVLMPKAMDWIQEREEQGSSISGSSDQYSNYSSNSNVTEDAPF